MDNDTAPHRPIPPLTGGLADHLDTVLTGTGHDADAVLASLTKGAPASPSDTLLAEIHDGYTASTTLDDPDTATGAPQTTAATDRDQA